MTLPRVTPTPGASSSTSDLLCPSHDASTCPATIPGVTASGPSLGSWVDLTASLNRSPPARYFASMAYDPTDHEVVLFGGRGCSSPSGDCNDTWSYSNGTWVQLFPTLSPPARRGAALTWDSQDGYLVLFGGMNDSYPYLAFQDTWTFLGGQWTDRTPTVVNSTNTPSVRFVAQMTDDPAAGYILLFGGCEYEGCGSPMDDTWSYLNGTWTDRTYTVGPGPSSRAGEAFVWDPASRSVLLYGGDLPSSHLNDTWQFSNGTWSQLHPVTYPGNRGDSWTLYDPIQGAVFLFGGLLDVPSQPGHNGPVADTWEWTGGEWSNVTQEITGSPSPRWALSETGTFDVADGYGLLFGGGVPGGGVDNLTWKLTLDYLAPTVTANATPTNGTAPLTVAFAGNATGGAPPYSYAWSYGDSTAAGAGASVVHQYVAPGVYHVTLTVLDGRGNQGYANLSVGVVSPLSAKLTPSPQAGVAPLEVQWAATVSGGNPPDSYAWDFGDGTANVSGPTVSPHDYRTAGNYSARLKVIDSQGRSVTVTSAVEVVAPLALSAETASHTLGDAPLAVSFNVTRSGGLGPFTYEWTFGDGGSSTLPAPAHDFGVAGSYNASVQVIDSLGESASVSETIRVAPALTVSVAASTASVLLEARLYLNASASGGTGSDEFTWSGLPGGCVPTGLAEWSCTPAETGTFSIVVTVTDQVPTNASASVSVVVHAAGSVHPTPSGGPSLGIEDWLAILAAIVVGALLIVLLWRRQRRAEVAVEADVEAAVVDSGLPPVPGPTTTGAATATVPFAPPGGPGPTLSMAEQILAHIYGLGRLDATETAPIGFTQEGISQVLGRPQNVFGKVLTRMEASGLVVAEVRHIQGGRRRRKVYRLTDRGEEAARQVRSRLGTR